MLFRILLLLLFLPINIIKADSLADYLSPNRLSTGIHFEFKPELYYPRNLHEYNNGEAELYKRYHFVKMAAASYRTSDSSGTFVIDLYDMGKPLNAFGIYSHFRNPDMDFADIGDQAILTDYSLRFYKGHYYVNMVAGTLTESVHSVIRQTAEKLASMLPTDKEDPELAFLRHSDMVENSLRLHNPFRLNDHVFESGLSARYRQNDMEWSAFVILFDSVKQSLEAINVLRESESALSNHDVLLKSQSRYIWGVKDYADLEQAKRFLDNLLQHP